MRLRLIPAVIFIALFSDLSASAQTPSGRDVVAPLAVTSFDPVARNSSFQLAVVLKIRTGFHVNAREVSADYLIPTDLRAEVPTGFKADEISYPKGTLRTFSFSKKPLNVYEGTTIVRMKLTTAADTPLGQQRIPLKLRYQACSDEICLPPVTVDVQAKFTVVAEPAAAKPAHSEFFKLK
ncbi:MAG TPA: protein-disulfide reductase DsbD domain-containing protein [Candidatus Dormibacteraeota bacterium]|nr:protein-disulfide reductase DsbD domain-containing protein [Candidatus Dormibacteraeota bacterium]